MLSIVAEGNWDFLYQAKALGELKFMECLSMIEYFYRWGKVNVNSFPMVKSNK